MVTLKGRTFNIKSTLNGGASLSDVAVKWLAIRLKIKIPKKNMKKTDQKPWCVDLFTSNCPNNNQLPILHHTYVNIIK